MNVILGVLRYGFLGLLAIFIFYVVWLLRKDVE